MARYRIDNAGLPAKEVLRQLVLVESHFEAWGVVITGITMNPSQTTIDTDIAVTSGHLGGHTFEEHLGFPLIVVSL